MYYFVDRPAALIYYMMAADTGLEVATFNLAYLCEENKASKTAIISSSRYFILFYIAFY